MPQTNGPNLYFYFGFYIVCFVAAQGVFRIPLTRNSQYRLFIDVHDASLGKSVAICQGCEMNPAQVGGGGFKQKACLEDKPVPTPRVVRIKR
jgi:hypothetical protein